VRVHHRKGDVGMAEKYLVKCTSCGTPYKDTEYHTCPECGSRWATAIFEKGTEK